MKFEIEKEAEAGASGSGEYATAPAQEPCILEEYYGEYSTSRDDWELRRRLQPPAPWPSSSSSVAVSREPADGTTEAYYAARGDTCCRRRLAEERHPCTFCNEVFRSSNDLAEHLWVRAGWEFYPVEAAEPAEIPKVEQRPYCVKRCGSRGALEAHLSALSQQRGHPEFNTAMVHL